MTNSKKTSPKEHFTPGPWAVFINDCGDEHTGWPISIGPEDDDDKSVVRPGGFYPYEWDAAMSMREAVANADLMTAAPEMYALLKSLAGDASLTEQKRLQIEEALSFARGERRRSRG